VKISSKDKLFYFLSLISEALTPRRSLRIKAVKEQTPEPPAKEKMGPFEMMKLNKSRSKLNALDETKKEETEVSLKMHFIQIQSIINIIH